MACFLVLLLLGLMFMPGSPYWNYANSHQRIDTTLNANDICGGAYYENITILNKRVMYKDDYNGKRMAHLFTCSDGIEREVIRQDVYYGMHTNIEYRVVSVDMACGRHGHNVFVFGVVGGGDDRL
jgi:hypothetical protein